MADRNLGRTLWNFVLALLNATLILAALCLWLAWSVLSSAERVAAELRATATSVQPVRQEVQSLRQDIQSLRSDLVGFQSGEWTRSAEISASIEGLQVEIANLADEVRELDADPQALIQTAVEVGFAELGVRIARFVPVLAEASSEPQSASGQTQN